MNNNSFVKLAADIHLFFSKKLPDARQLELWFEEVKQVPDIAIDTIYRHIINQEAMPRNVPHAVQSGWQEWRRVNPSKVAHIETFCNMCQSKGFYRLKMAENGNSWIVRCGSCENWKSHFGTRTDIPARTRSECEAAGLLIFPPKDAHPGEWKCGVSSGGLP